MIKIRAHKQHAQTNVCILGPRVNQNVEYLCLCVLWAPKSSGNTGLQVQPSVAFISEYTDSRSRARQPLSARATSSFLFTSVSGTVRVTGLALGWVLQTKVVLEDGAPGLV